MGRLPTAGIENSKPDVSYHAFSIPEMERFFSVIPTDTVIGLRDRAIFLMYFWTARRRREILDLCYGDIQRGIVMDDSGPREGWIYHFRGKRRKSIDDIAELPLPAKEAIDRYLEASGRLATIERDDPLFLAVGPEAGGGYPIDPYRHLSSSTIHNAFKKYCKIAGIDASRGLTVHSWRHTAAFQCRIAGQDIVSIKELLRHQSLEVAYRYVQSLTGTGDSDAKLLESRFAFLSKI